MGQSFVKRVLSRIDWPPGRRPGSAPRSPSPPLRDAYSYDYAAEDAPQPAVSGDAAAPAPAPPDDGIADTPDARRTALRKAFTPTHPLRSARRLAGRRTQLARVLRAVLAR